MNCERVQAALSQRMDGEWLGARRTAAVDDHLATCLACRTFVARADRVRKSVRIHSADQIPDLTGRIMQAIEAEPRRLGRSWRRRREARARPAWPHLVPIGAALLVGLVAGSLVVGGPWQRPQAQRVAAADVVRGVRASARNLEGYQAHFAIAERALKGSTVRSFTMSVEFAAPERYRLDLTELPKDAAGQPLTHLIYIVDGTATYRSGPLPCLVVAESNPCIPTTAPVTAASAYAPAVPSPADLAVPIDVLGNSRRIAVIGTGTVLGRRAVEVELPFQRAEPLFPFRSLGGTWLPIFPGDRAVVWLDASRWFPLRATVYPSSDPDRQAWALRFGQPNSQPGQPILDLRTTSISTAVPAQGDFVIPGGTAPHVVPPSVLRKEVGFPPVRPTFVAGLAPTSAVVPPEHSGSSGPQSLLTYSSGVTYLRVGERRQPQAPAPLGSFDPAAQQVHLTNGVAYYEPATADQGRRLTIHSIEQDLVLETNLPRDELLQIASTLPVRGERLPRKWLAARAGGDLTRLVTLARARRAAGFPVAIPATLPAGYVSAGVILTRIDGVTGVTVTFRQAESDLDGGAIDLYVQPARRLPPLAAGKPRRDHVSRISGRWTPSMQRSRLEWLSGGLYYSLSVPGDDLGEAIGIATSVSPPEPS